MRAKTKSKFISLNKRLYDLFNDKEMLTSTIVNERANLLLLKMQFRGNQYTFAVPWRSNRKKGTTPSNSYFNIPPTTKTREGNIACLDFNKACILPNKKKNKDKYYSNYIVSEIKDTITILYIEKHKKEIIQKFQNYLNTYDSISDKYYHVDLDNCLNKLKQKDLL